MTDNEEFKIELPEDFKINLDEFEDNDEEESDEDDEEETKEESIEDIVNDTPTSPPPNINFSSDFAPQQFVSSQPISPVLERREIPQQTNLEDEFPEFQTTQQETAGQQAQAYDAGSDYYASNYQENARAPETMDFTNPTLQQDFTRMQSQPRLSSTDTSWGTPRTENWEKHYEAKFTEPKRDRRRR